jgi:Leucine-rich repeat (LRR) protein
MPLNHQLSTQSPMSRDASFQSMSVVFIAGGALLCAAALLQVGSGSNAVDPWVSARLTDAEIAHVRRLAKQISQDERQTPDAPDREHLRTQAAALSVREAAALGILLSREWNIDPQPWIEPAAQRERRARERLNELLAHFDPPEASYPRLQMTIRGPDWLQEQCGKEPLTEVTGVGIWRFYDGGIPAPSDFSDDQVAVLLDLPGLERVWLQYSQLTDAGVEQLATLPRLAEYHLAGCSNLTDASLRAMARPELRLVDVTAAAEITDGGIAALAVCPNLEELLLEKTGITSASLVTIGRLRTLRQLTLNETAIRNHLDRLRPLRQLEHLSLARLGDEDAPLAEESLAFLSDLKHLSSLDLDGTAVSKVELRQLPELKRLSIGHPALKELALTDLPQIESLQFTYPWSRWRNEVRLERLKFDGLSGLRHLAVRGFDESAAAGLAVGLRSSPHLTRLYLSPASMTDELAQAIGRLGELEQLDLGQSPLSDVQLSEILKAPRLVHLTCGGGQLTAEGLQLFGRYDRLKRLKLSDVELADLSVLGTAQSLEQLELWDCHADRFTLSGHPALDALIVRLGSIERLQVEQSPRFRRLIVSNAEIGRLDIQSCHALTSVSGGGTNLGIVALSDLPKLTNLTIQERASVEELQLMELPELRSVSFWAAQVSLRALEALIELASLRNLDVSGTNLGDEAAAIIGRMTSLQSLSASSHFTRRGLEHIARLPNLRRILLYRHDELDWNDGDARRMFPNMREFTVFKVRPPKQVPDAGNNPGSRRPVPDRIDERETHRADVCPDCGGPLNRCSETRTRYVEEIPYPWYEQIQQEALDSGVLPAKRSFVGRRSQAGTGERE